ncbi:MAG: sugar phosphate isomerase/epimerase [Spirochaetaceae bacterium]|jgi:sugar phosphate isomerase/epimerase|nr:sugar phosphate isomerase/epimerase [Spirochaetaceae bacterium]
MRLGGPVFIDTKDPEAFVYEHIRKGYRAAYCPDWINQDRDAVLGRVFKKALEKQDLILAEVGIWRNTLSPNPEEAKAAFEYSVRRLQTAEELEAKCAVNIVGSWCETNWDGPHEAHYRADFFDAAVESARKVIDAVNPKKTKMTFEIMPCQFIDCAAEYLRFLKAVDRKAAGIHLDPTNSITAPRWLYNNASFFKNEFALLGSGVISIHLKDLRLNPREFTVQMEEVVIGKGSIDYIALLKLIDKLPPDTPGMLEHLETEARYDEAAESIRALAGKAGLSFR